MCKDLELPDDCEETTEGTSSNSALIALLARRLPGDKYVKIGEDMVWPSPAQEDLEWRCRYNTNLTREDMLVLASIVSAYNALVDLPQKKRNAICKALKSC